VVVQLLNLSDLSSDAKNALIFRLLDDFQQLQRTVKSLQKPSGKSPPAKNPPTQKINNSPQKPGRDRLFRD